MFFAANDGVHGQELWKSDGTEAGTVLVKDISRGDSPTGAPSSLTAVGGRCSSPPTTTITAQELWKSDGTGAGTVLVKDIKRGDIQRQPLSLTAVGRTVVLRRRRRHPRLRAVEVERHQAGTVLVKDIQPGAASGSPSNLAAVGKKLFFTADDGVHGQQLWKSNGRRSGTALVKDIWPRDDDSYDSIGYPQ